MGTNLQTTYQCRLFPHLGTRLPGISYRQEWGQALPNQSQDRQAIRHRHWPTGPPPASPTVPHTCTYWPMGSSSWSCSKILFHFFVFLYVKPPSRLIQIILLHGTPDLGRKPGQDLIVVVMELVELCPPGRYPGHHCREFHRLKVRDSSRQIDRCGARSPRASPVSKHTICIE